MTQSKFKVGDKVYSIQYGIGEVISCTRHETIYPFDVVFDSLDGDSHSFTACGRIVATNTNPTLLTLSEARTKGYDVPKETIKKSFVLYGFVYEGNELAGPMFNERENAVKFSKSLNSSIGVATVTVEWEEEI